MPATLWEVFFAWGKSLRVGLGLIAQTPVLRGSLIVTGVMMLGIGSVNVLFVPFLANVLHVPITWFGVIEFAQILGMLLSSGGASAC